jgi:glycosyltransferase involved in cell wall biosynthesis/lipopolysaccharide biosynthesis glycosyltransferase
MLEKRAAELHLEAIELLDGEATLHEGLRMTTAGAVRQGAGRLAVQAGGELIALAAATVADRVLYARALLVAGRHAEALEAVRGLPESGVTCTIAACAHAGLGQVRPARRLAKEALRLGDLPMADKLRARWLQAYASACIGSGTPELASRWQGELPDDATVPVIAILDYRAPDVERKSRNIGDWIQTLAALRHLARLDGVTWSFDDPQLEPLLARLRNTWSENERIACPGRAHLTVLDRDYPACLGERYAGRRVWVLANGWYAHPVFGESLAWPAPENIEPLLLSVHAAQPTDLRPQVLDWLRSNGPVGCRDRSTLEWLSNQGVPAYLSGCLTMTLRAPSAPVRSGERLAVDVEGPLPQGWTEATQLHDELRETPFAQIVARAMATVDRFAAAAEIRTSRLHCALPARAVGTPVTFEPSVASDRRFEGLVDADESTWTRTRDDLTETMAQVLPLVVGGAEPAAVRDVLRRRVANQGRSVPVARGVLAAGPAPAEVTLALAFDANFISQACTVLAAVRATTQAALRVVLLVRGVEEDIAARVAAIAQPIESRVIPMDGRLEGTAIELLDQISISTMDRLFLPELLPDLDRVVYIDCDTLAFDDIAQLAACDPGPTGIAARPTPNRRLNNLAEAVERRARNLAPADARALREWSSGNVDLAAPYFNAGVLVLSLATLRDNGTTQRALELVRRFGFHDQDALNFVTAGGANQIPDAWNAMPGVDLCLRPSLVHWVGRRKPWLPESARYQARWREFEAAAAPVLALRGGVDTPRQPTLQTIAFQEPAYPKDDPDTWKLRAGYKYPGLLAALRGKAKPLILMETLPPQDDPYRLALEESFGVTFMPLRQRAAVHGRDSTAIATNIAAALEGHKVHVLSNLNGQKLHQAYAGALAAERMGAEYVYRIGGDDIGTEEAIAQRDQRWYHGSAAYWDSVATERLTLARARTVIVMSPWEQDRVAALCDDPSRIRVCWRGVDLDTFAPKSYPAAAGRFLFVGRNSHEKGFDIVQSAAALLRESHPDIEIIVAGPFQPRTEGNIRYVGYVPSEELPALYASADAFVLCSRTEGMPQTVMEAMAAGRACILSRHLFAQMFRHGEQALLSDTDPAALRDQMVRLHDTPELATLLGRAGRQFAQAHFGSSANLAAYEQALLGTEVPA